MIDPADALTRLLPIAPTGPIRVRFESETRAYVAMLTEDLFGCWVVVHGWGGLFNRRGGGMTRVVENYDAGVAVLAAITTQRQARGYRLIDIQTRPTI